MEVNVRKPKAVEVYLLLALVSFNISNLFNITVGGMTLRLHHLVTFAFFAITIFIKKRPSLKMNLLVIFYFFALFLSVVVASRYGFGKNIVNVLYCLLLFAVVSSWEEEIDRESLYRIFQYAGYFFVIAIVINLLFQWETLVYSFGLKSYHILATTIVSGGVNIEATMLATYACFFLYRKKYGFWIFSLLISMLYLSRTAMFLNLLSAGMLLVNRIRVGGITSIDRKKKTYGVFLLALFFAALGVMYGKGYFTRVIGRFLTIGKDNGSSVRMLLWTNAWNVFRENPFGVGIGNAIPCIREICGEKIGFDNIHCVYLQVLVETGVAGLILFLLSACQIIKKAVLTWFSDPLGSMVVGYLVCCILQFRGTEPFYTLLWALFLRIENADLKSC